MYTAKQLNWLCHTHLLTENGWKSKIKIMRKEYLERFVGSWNGEDNEFIFEGDIYTEDDVHEAEDELAEIVGRFINEKLEENYIGTNFISTDLERHIVEVANFCTLARSPVNMNKKNPCVVDYVPEREQPPRMAMMMKNIAIGLMHIDNEDELSESNAKIIYKIGLDSIPVERKLVLMMLTKYRSATTRNLSIKLNYSTETVRAWLSQLNALQMVDREAGRGGKNGDSWSLRQEYKNILRKYLNIETIDTELEVSDEEDKNAYIEEENTFEVPQIVSQEQLDEVWGQF